MHNRILRYAQVLISVMKWCWARLPGGIVTWETYEMFKVGEKGQSPPLCEEYGANARTDSGMARDAFATFIPISVESNERVRIITDFFDLIAALAAHGKSNGLGGLKLSRYAGWWAFGHIDTGKGFDAGYKSWERFVLGLLIHCPILTRSVRLMRPVIFSLPICAPCRQRARITAFSACLAPFNSS
jgi:hypothetical protein